MPFAMKQDSGLSHDGPLLLSPHGLNDLWRIVAQTGLNGKQR